jgi:alpha-1,2-mannosyltransferase
VAFITPLPDHDEVYNYWEPTHYLQYGNGLKMSTLAPIDGIYSWIYTGLHAILGTILTIISRDKVS